MKSKKYYPNFEYNSYNFELGIHFYLMKLWYILMLLFRLKEHMSPTLLDRKTLQSFFTNFNGYSFSLLHIIILHY